MTLCGNPLLRSLFGVKRTAVVAAHMSANDPKRTCKQISTVSQSYLDTERASVQLLLCELAHIHNSETAISVYKRL
jgi:hypothetical protein